MVEPVKAKRMGNIELLRIVSMLLIICWHFGCHCIKIEDFDFTILGCFHWIVRSFANNAVNIYILISAYFLCRSSFKLNKLISLIAEVWFYSVVIYTCMITTNQTEFSFKSALAVLLPVLSGSYWFASSYVLMYILAPFINKCLDNITQKQHLTLMAILLVSFSVIPNFLFFFQWINWGSSCGIVWMLVLYVVGAYLRRYVDLEQVKKQRKKYAMYTVLLCLLPFITKVVIAYISKAFTGEVIGSSLFYMNNSVLIVASSIAIFLLFSTLEISGEISNNIIRFIAPSTFAVYLIHDNVHISNKLWGGVRGAMHLTDFRCIYEFFVVVLAIFCCCILIDLFRRMLFMAIKKTNVCIKLNDKISNIKLL